MPGGQSVAIIALTATAFDEDREQILLDGCDDFVRKPFRKDEIFDMLSKHLDVRFIYEEEPAPTPDAVEAGAPIPSEDLESLVVQSPEWITELRQAALTADLYRILDLVERIHRQHPSLADSLSNLAERFEYQKILNLIEAAGGER